MVGAAALGEAAAAGPPYSYLLAAERLPPLRL